MNIDTLNDLAAKSDQLVFSSYSEFQNRSDGYKNMQNNYPSLDFGKIIIVNQLGLRYSGLQNGKGDVGVGFTTDGQLTSPQLVVMKDPKSIWPFYYPAPVVRSDVLKKYPKVKKVLDSVNSKLNVDIMRQLNGKVDLQHEDPADVAKQFLQQKGIVD
jgi:osmoprotectant transport system substrate-binding protein